VQELGVVWTSMYVLVLRGSVYVHVCIFVRVRLEVN
jgi:hypothetical protein